jgi:hypothetical protein
VQFDDALMINHRRKNLRLIFDDLVTELAQIPFTTPLAVEPYQFAGRGGRLPRTAPGSTAPPAMMSTAALLRSRI